MDQSYILAHVPAFNIARLIRIGYRGKISLRRLRNDYVRNMAAAN